MISVAKTSLLIALILSSGTSLCACDRKSGNDVLDDDPFAARSTAKENQFGKGFGKASRAAPNSEPVNVAEGDVIPVSNTDEPVELN